MSNLQNQKKRRAASNWNITFLLLVATIATALSAYYAVLFGSDDNQLLRFGLWVILAAASFATLVCLFAALDAYDVKLRNLPSTYLSLVAIVLACVFVVSHSDTIQSENLISVFDELSNVEMAMLAFFVVIVAVSAALNVANTNIILGLIVTAFQLALSILLIAFVLLALVAFSDKSKNKKNKAQT